MTLGWDGEAAVIALDAVPFVQRGVLYVPLCYLAGAAGHDVDWHPATRTVSIRSWTTE